ncbi:MAG: hypothetical protein GY775_11700 [Candidatus Scalindua sp.]|nr:hypothetical protein [Candidatus Scalindua sp.]
MDLMEKYLSRVKPEGREKKLKPISDEMLLSIYHKAMDKINVGYIAGTTPYIQKHNKPLDIEINKADDRVNEVWQRCNKGEASLDDFKDALGTYQSLYLKAIDIKRAAIAPTIEKLCACGRPAITYYFGEVEDGNFDWIFYCNNCNLHTNDINKSNTIKQSLCRRCGKQGQRFCLGESKSGKHVWGQFCLECYPHNF